jgi:hypothetical protein
MTVRGHVTNGRLVVDAPTDLPEGTEVELVAVVDVIEANAPPDAPLDVIAYVERMTPEELAQDRRLLERDRIHGDKRAPDEV